MSEIKQKICVVGSGAWGSAIAMLLDRNGHEVTLWSYEPEVARTLTETGRNPFLAGVELPRSIRHSSDISCVQGHKFVVMASPSFAVRQTSRNAAKYLEKDAVLISVAKGIEADTGLRMSEIIAEETGCRVAQLSMVMDGPDDQLSRSYDAMMGNLTAVIGGFSGEEMTA